MPIDKELLKILACPDCKGGIIQKKKSKTNSHEYLKCKKCQRKFEIKDGIPIMLPKD